MTGYTTALVQLPLVRESAAGERVSTPAAANNALADMGDLAQESFQILTVNAKNRIVGRHLITLGLLDASLVHPREIFRAAILDGAAAIILAHNHPSGETEPSAEDIRTTRQLIEAGKILDHIIIAHGGEFLSMRESGAVSF